MLHIEHKSTVPHSFELVSANFGQELFLAIAPAFPPTTLISFDGDRVGGLVKIKLGLGFLSQIWISEIVSREENEGHLEFVDVGLALPPPLKTWRHKHIVKKIDQATTLIIDDIQYTSGSKVLDYMMYPVMKRMFAQRSPAYRGYFEEVAKRDGLSA